MLSRWPVCEGNPDGCNYGAATPWPEGIRRYIRNLVIGGVHVGVNEPPGCGAEEAAPDPPARVGLALTDGLPVEEGAARLICDHLDANQLRPLKALLQLPRCGFQPPSAPV